MDKKRYCAIAKKFPFLICIIFTIIDYGSGYSKRLYVFNFRVAICGLIWERICFSHHFAKWEKKGDSIYVISRFRYPVRNWRFENLSGKITEIDGYFHDGYDAVKFHDIVPRTISGYSRFRSRIAEYDALRGPRHGYFCSTTIVYSIGYTVYIRRQIFRRSRRACSHFPIAETSTHTIYMQCIRCAYNMYAHNM